MGDKMIKKVFDYFKEIAKIPHGSGNTKQISDYLADFAKKRNLEHYQDEVNNIIIIKEAGKGYENAPAVIIQGHMDMVCAKDPDCTKDMTKEGIDVDTDGEFLFAKGTTLGGDNGIAVAYALALLDDNENQYPRIEAVITVDEEIGLLGASHIDLSMLKGKIMLNIDSEAEGIFTAGCAGGLREDCYFDIKRENIEKDTYKITLKGLKGGHSGIDINKNRANANKVMGEILSSLNDINIVSVSGGSADNVIPSQCEAIIKAESVDTTNVEKALKEQYKDTEPDLTIITEKINHKGMAMNEQSTKMFIELLNILPNGVQAMHTDIDGLVKTSLNMGIVNTDEDKFHIAFSIRSSSDKDKYALADKVKELAEVNDGTAEIRGDYCGWDYKKDSKLRELMCDVFKKQYGKEPVIDIIHAGLECGIISSKIDGLDCISFGPNLHDIYTPKEKLDIKSAERVWNFVKAVLKEIK